MTLHAVTGTVPEGQPDSARVVLEALAAMQTLHNREMAKLTGEILALRRACDEHGIQVDTDAGELALIQFRRFRNALEAVYNYFDGDVPPELRQVFMGTILT